MGYWQTFYHLVWGTKNRLLLIDEERDRMIQQSIRATCLKQDAFVFAIGTMPDHVHLAVSIPPTLSVAEFMRLMKGASSHLVNRASARSTHETFAWQAEYGVFTFGERSLNEVRDYVMNQRKHHADGSLLPYFERLQPLVTSNGAQP
jgi:REP-associated tyrosine transposase